MKRLIVIISVLVLALAPCTVINAEVAAEPSASISGESSVTAGGSVTFSVSVDGCADADFVSLGVTLGEGLTLVSGEWKANGTASFDIGTGSGSLSTEQPSSPNGELISFSVKGESVSKEPKTLSVSILLKNGDAEVLSTSVGAELSVLCAEHTLGEYTQTDDLLHSRFCSVCPYAESGAHSWDEGVVTKEASCKEEGEREHTCPVCLGKKTEKLDKTEDHDYGEWSETKAPDCTNKGEETRVCSKCEKKDTREVDEKGHSVAEYAVIDKPSCTEEGTKEGECTVCHQKVTEKIEKTEHDYADPVVKKEATHEEEGVQVYICKDCKHEKEEKIPKLPAPETTLPTPPPVIVPPVTAAPETTEKAPETTMPEITFPEITFPLPDITEEPETTEKAPDTTGVPSDEEPGPTPAIAVVIAIVSVGCVILTVILIMKKNNLA